MAKREMMCPFSGDLCKNCALYIGRHYYRCFFENYRGYVCHPKHNDEIDSYHGSDDNPDLDFEMPETETEVLDPFTVVL